MASVLDEIDHFPSVSRSIIDNVNSKFAGLHGGLVPAIIAMVVAAVVTVGMFIINVFTTTEVRVSSCSNTLTYPQYSGNYYVLNTYIRNYQNIPQKSVPAAYSTCTSEGDECKDENDPNTVVWYTTSISMCINAEVSLRTYEPFRESDSQYSRPKQASTWASTSIISSQDCWPNQGRINYAGTGEPEAYIEICEGKADNYHVYSITQGTQVYGRAAIEASADLTLLTCPYSFHDGGHVPWTVEFEVQVEVCKYAVTTERMSPSVALGSALAYFNPVLAVIAGIMLKVFSCMLKKVDHRELK